MTEPVILGEGGTPRAASPEEIIEQGVRLYTKNMIVLLAEKDPRLKGRTPPDKVVDEFAFVVLQEVLAAIYSGFDKAVQVSGHLHDST